MLEANEHRRTLLQQGERPRRVGAVAGSGVRWVREHPVRLLSAAAAVVLLGTAGVVDPSSIDDEPRRTPIAAPPGSDEGARVAKVTATLTLAGQAGDAEPESADDVEPDGTPADESGEAWSADPGVADGSPSSDQRPKVSTTTPSVQPPDTETNTAPTPELSDTGETDDGQPEPAESTEPEAPEEETDTSDGTCLGVNALGLTVNLCTSLLE